MYGITEEVTIFATRPSITLPDTSLRPSIILACGLTPMSLSVQGYRLRWITPAGEILTSNTGRYIVNNGPVPFDGMQFPGSVIAIEDLSYEDRGNYICEGQRTNTTDPNAWESATITLQLNCKLHTFQQELIYT